NSLCSSPHSLLLRSSRVVAARLFRNDPADLNKYLDNFIEKLMTAKTERQQGDKSPLVAVTIIPEAVVIVTRAAAASFKEQKTLIKIDKSALPINIVGDLHGEFRELRMMLSKCGDPICQSYLFLAITSIEECRASSASCYCSRSSADSRRRCSCCVATTRMRTRPPRTASTTSARRSSPPSERRSGLTS
ncbi:hypothetical protein PENTCL1PPCAC_3072, partial [Pristionchus entomophagus]